MRPRLLATADAQDGLFLRQQALSSGYTEREFVRLAGSRGEWTRVRYGVYVESAKWDAQSGSARALLVDRAALLVCDPGTVLSHSSAARLLGLDLHGADDGLTHVTRTRAHGRRIARVESGVKHHCGQVTPGEINRDFGLPSTDAARTILDVTAEFGYLAGLVCADSALRNSLTVRDLLARLELRDFDRRLPTLQAVVADARPGSESALETLSRSSLCAMGIDDLVLQYPLVLAPGWEVRVDLYSPRLRHVFECDGRQKYSQPLEQLSGRVDPEEVLWREKRREDLIRGLALGMSRITWVDVQPDRRERFSARIWREIDLQHGEGWGRGRRAS